MTWFKLDDQFWGHRKVILAGNAAAGLFCRAGSWCSQNLTEGFLPREVVRTLGTKSQIDSLVRVGLWTVTEGGFQMPDFLEYNPPRERVIAEREAANERKRRSREKSRRDIPRDAPRDGRRESGRGHTHPVPDPVPSTSSVVTPSPDVTRGWIDDLKDDLEAFFGYPYAMVHVLRAVEMVRGSVPDPSTIRDPRKYVMAAVVADEAKFRLNATPARMTRWTETA